MARYLIVANQTLGGEHLTEKVREVMAPGASFYVLVPATPPQGHAVFTEGEARAIAAERLEAALIRLRDLGAEVDGEVGGEEPTAAVRDVMRDQEFDEIIISTLPAGVSRWLKLDLVSNVKRAFDLPVTHIEGEGELT
ncbi:MAG: hypothetical protein ACRDH6_07450 [Actinomycetota bacterium]